MVPGLPEAAVVVVVVPPASHSTLLAQSQFLMALLNLVPSGQLKGP